MKGEILCPKCYDRMPAHIKQSNPYPGEYSKTVTGEAIRKLLCDSCVRPILPGDKCHAFTLWTDIHGIPWSPWEHDYIKEINDAESPGL